MAESVGEAIKYFQKMEIRKEDINILLMGETGVGKSTFINAFANYMKFDKFNVAEKNEAVCLIPAKFDVTDENFDVKTVQIGKSVNENDEIGESATQQSRSYVFPIGRSNIRLRLIDTPGIGDTRGLSQDTLNLKNILSCIGNLEHLHAVCFLLKPNNTRLTVIFKYYVKQLLSILEKSANKNVIFLFTNTRNTFYRPGDTLPALRKILHEINTSSSVCISLNKENIFCLDNEAFRFMVSCQNGITFTKEDRQSFSLSWDQSVKECWRMIDIITGKGHDTKLIPHLVAKTISTNEARDVITQLSKTLADIADLINDNVIVLERHKNTLLNEETSIKDLEDRLYVPVVDLDVITLQHPITVCTNTKCCEVYTIEGSKKFHYKQICHDPCYLDMTPRDLIGPPELVNCYAIDHPSKLCGECKCDFSSHMHVYYLTRTNIKKIVDYDIQKQITGKQSALESLKSLVESLDLLSHEYKGERDVIVKCMAKFAHYLKRNAIVTYNDAYQDYIAYLIDREKSYGPDANKQTITYYQDLLKQYVAEKSLLDEALKSGDGDTTALSSITSRDILDSVGTLFSLKHTGNKISSLHLEESKLRSKESKFSQEYVLEESSLRCSNPESKSNSANKKIFVKKGSSSKDSEFGDLLKWYFDTKSKK